MSYLVLARKWRPKRFAELVGQEHVVRALTNALDSGRVHHAFLFSGTRGVGKTTIARIFAKSLNCEQGTSADPCGECNSCRDIDAGRFIDLLEIDAASNTGVDDVRDLIDNAQYMPSRGRVKVYLIDEVHMLSKSAFNALLKTLEEPPGHVKFLLATTDPQKLPVTVLSRCLQFNLKRLDEDQIGGQVEKILQAEGIQVEPGAVRQISRAADGSLRDGLSLLDQAIAYTGGQLTDAAVATMLGTVDQTRVGALLDALASGDGAALMAEVAALAEFSPDWAGVLEALSDALHRIQVRQLVPGVSIEVDGVAIDALAARLPAELVQLWYQMAINGRRDLSLAPSQRAGFEMSVLRMLAFRPAGPEAARSGPASGGSDVTAGGTAGAGSSGSASPSPTTVDSAPAPSSARALADTRIADASETRFASAKDSGTSQSPISEDSDVADADNVGAAPEPQAAVRQPADAADAAGVAEPAGAGGATNPPSERRTPPRSAVPDVPADELPETPQAAGRDPDGYAPDEREQTPFLSLEDEAEAVAVVATAPEPGEQDSKPRPAHDAESNDASAQAAIADADAWHAWVVASPLKGPARVLAEHVGFIACEGRVVRLGLSPEDELLNKPVLVAQIVKALAASLGGDPEIRFEASTVGGVSLRERNDKVRDARKRAAVESFMSDPQVRALIAGGATVVADSIRPRGDA